MSLTCNVLMFNHTAQGPINCVCAQGLRMSEADMSEAMYTRAGADWVGTSGQATDTDPLKAARSFPRFWECYAGQALANLFPLWLCWWPQESGSCYGQHKQTLILKPLLSSSLGSLPSLDINTLSSSSSSNLRGPSRTEPRAATHGEQSRMKTEHQGEGWTIRNNYVAVHECVSDPSSNPHGTPTLWSFPK